MTGRPIDGGAARLTLAPRREPDRRPAACALVAGALLLTIACGPAPEPCVECPDVAGTYHVEADVSGEPDCWIPFTGWEGTVGIAQSGPTLTLEGALPGTGTLYDNGSIVIRPLEQELYQEMDVRLTLTSSLTGEPGAWVIAGNWSAYVTDGSCQMSGPYRLTQQ